MSAQEKKCPECGQTIVGGTAGFQDVDAEMALHRTAHKMIPIRKIWCIHCGKITEYAMRDGNWFCTVDGCGKMMV